MILVDTSIWIDHINAGEPLLDACLMREQALMHPHVIGEIALGSLRNRDAVLARLLGLPVPNVVGDGDLLSLIDRWALWSTGIGYTDAHLLASALLTHDTRIWTRDRKLRAQAERLDVLAELD